MNRGWFAMGVCFLVAAQAASAEIVELSPTKDNTLYFPDGPAFLSNGAGDYMFSGATFVAGLRRAVLAFDVAGNIEAGSTITSASLTLHMSRTAFFAEAEMVRLHQLTADWGEGASDAQLEEGSGAFAENGDATWAHTFFNTDFWTTSGGDFNAVSSAATLVDGIASYTWSSAALAADVQDMLDNAAGDFGWILVGNESTVQTTKRFDTRENPVEDFRPVLTVEFDPPPAKPVPSVSQWGQALMFLLLLATGTIIIGRRAAAACG